MNKIINLILTILIFQLSVNAQQKSENIKTALLIIDIQNFYFPGEGTGLVNAEPASLVAKEILQIFRDKDQLVVHVRHKSSSGFEIHKNVEPIADEKVITKEEINAFLNTELLDYLKGNEINRLVIIGMQTQMCLEAAVRAAHDFGFECFVIEDACATRDLTFDDKVIKAGDVHYSTLATIKGGGYASVINLGDFIENMDTYLYQDVK